MKKFVLIIFFILLPISLFATTSDKFENGKQLLKEMNFKEAEKIFLSLIQADSLNSKTQYYYALTLYNLKKYNKSIIHFSNSINIKPSSGAYRNRGATYFNLRKYQKAIDDYNSAILLDSTDADAYYRRGHAYKNGFNDIIQALTDYTKALKFDSTHVWAYVNKGNVNLQLGKYEQAIENYSNALKYNTKLSQAYYSRGTAYMKLSNCKNAIDDFSKTIELNDSFYLAYYYKGICLESVGEKTEAIRTYKLALQFVPQHESEIINNINKRIK